MTHKPIPYTPDVETLGTDEAQTFAAMNKSFHQIQSTTCQDYGRAIRGVHAKSHGILKARLEILENLPPELAQGLVAQSGRYDAIMRFSTNPGDILDDSVSTPRGLAVKILNIPGQQMLDSEGATQDFVMANAPSFNAKDAQAFQRNLKLLAATTDTPQIFKKGLSALLRGAESALEAVGTSSSKVVTLGGHPETHILGETFYSQVPLRWGQYVAKVAIAPVAPELMQLTNQPLNVNGKPDGLRQAVMDFFSQQQGVWEVRVQLRTNADTMPVEDASAIWPEDQSPYEAVARLTASQQPTWDEERANILDEQLAFNPWHGLIDHQPLGSIMRARRATYQKSAEFRTRHNGCPLHVPTRLSA